MSMASPRSIIGCFTCKIEHEECYESKPDCPHCQHPRIERGVECTEYTDIERVNKPNGKFQTLVSPCGPFDRSRGSPLVNTNELDDLVPSANIDSTTTLPSVGAATPTNSGLVNPLEALSRLDQPPGMDQPPHCAHPTNDSLSDPSLPLSPISISELPDIKRQDELTAHEDENLEGAVSVIRREPVLDRTLESNALPFILQGYATWINRLALDPLKLARITRDFVCSHFEDGDQSRWIITLLANTGNSIGRAELVHATVDPIISALDSAVRRRLGAVKSRLKPTRSELVKALDSALETISMHLYADSPIEAMTLRQEAGPIFRQLCPESPGESTDPSSLLHHPLGCLRQYTNMDILLSVLTDMPTLYRYEVPIPGSQPADPYPSLPSIQEDGIVQWLYGVPNQIILLLGTMKAMHQDGLVPNGEAVASLEQGIRGVPAFSGSSSDRFLAIMRFVVQECWRQAAFIYLYTAVCGDSSDTPRVKDAFKRFMRLLNGTSPGRLPDEFLTSPLVLISPAAQASRDREVIRQRAVILHRRGRTYSTSYSILYIIEDYWARADAEGRWVVWSDVAVSRRHVLGV
ncbi:hypothetical protein B0J17DRAFT_640167 [Rhizoctonia solani]|nr:hypothetical protein B0J17DRAFT_640167 [Rhizoctonia solani]